MIEQVTIQEILPAHTTAMANLIRSIFEELEIPKVGTAYEDPSLNDLYKAYQAPTTQCKTLGPRSSSYMRQTPAETNDEESDDILRRYGV